MAKPLTPQPEPLKGRAFTVEEGIELGLTPQMLRHRRFETPFHGMRSLEQTKTCASRAVTFATILREGEAFSHGTALLLLGCPIRVPLDQTLHVVVPAPLRARRTRGVIGHVCRQPFTSWSRADGVQVVPPLMALVQSAATLSLRELVVAIDSLGLPRRGSPAFLDLASIEKDLRGYSGRGIRDLRRAAGFARVGAESRMETLLRLVLEAFGLAEHFELQVELSDGAGWIGRFDLVCKRCRLVLEYDGEQHRTDREQYLKDLRRLDRVREAGYRVIRVHAGELLTHPEQIARKVASALGVEFVPEPRVPELLR